MGGANRVYPKWFRFQLLDSSKGRWWCWIIKLLDALLLKADRFSVSLRKSRWNSEEVSEALGFDFRPEKERKPVKELFQRNWWKESMKPSREAMEDWRKHIPER
ncbi:hypothetical protein SESBI_02209 [Sesbania bispinosa]|nr:hypothetical protein SESBI_02209 [Sesbania bispinosa]